MTLFSKTFAVIALSLPLLAHAQALNPHAQKLVETGGKLNAVGQLCNHFSDKELDEARENQMKLSRNMGVSPAQFQQWFAQGQAQTKARWSAMSEIERTQACNQMSQMGKGGQ